MHRRIPTWQANVGGRCAKPARLCRVAALALGNFGCHAIASPPVELQNGPAPAAVSRSSPRPEPFENGDARTAVARRGGPGAVLRETEIHFDLHGRPTTLPLVRVQIGSRATSFLLDTGATTHVIARWLAQDIKLRTTASATEHVFDHLGNRLDVSRTLDAVVRVDTWGTLPDTHFLVLDTPPVFEKSDVGGILSPQRLATPGRSILVDLDARRMALEETADAESLLLASDGCWLASSPVESCTSSSIAPESAPLFAVNSTIDESPARMLVNTGSIRSDVDSDAVLLKTSESSPMTFALSGESRSRIARSVPLRAGTCSFNIDVDVLPSAPDRMCTKNGNLGIDVLRHCRLLFDPSRFWARCSGI